MKLFEAKRMNWTLHCSDEWDEIVYSINDEGQYTKVLKSSGSPNDGFPDGIMYGVLEPKKLEELRELIPLLPTVEAHLLGCDGEGWEMTYFGQNGEVLYQTHGYINGVELLESIVDILP